MDIELMKEYIDYDPETGKMFWKKVMSNRAKAGDECGINIDSKGYKRVCFNGKQYRAHRVAWSLYYGREPASILDHINGNRTDNRICNLREVDDLQNARNRVMGRNNTSGHKGVTFHKSAGKWVAQIMVNRRNKYLGIYEDKHQAINARLDAEKKYFGDKCRINL